MSDDISVNELDNIQKTMQSYINNFDEIDKEICNLLQNSNANTTALEEHSVETQKSILDGRDKALSIGFIAISAVALIIRRFRTASKLVDLFIHLVNRFVSLITRYEKLFKINSIQVTISLTPSVIVTFKP
ncbi:MAG: hypothetical protein KGI02_03345 [Thaumarchaeota archaeon]|nr:hypothetical protein [Nitrososphaerota archaeon]MDE1831388.1 hypothetical protein [Nitrososphaerota archaeon]MDE1840307.1 hypothetical protein [Nitrososphaerota archaeon]MDE1876908.1 hypothetical protein [Nitrososphaerota archaeon]